MWKQKCCNMETNREISESVKILRLLNLCLWVSVNVYTCAKCYVYVSGLVVLSVRVTNCMICKMLTSWVTIDRIHSLRFIIITGSLCHVCFPVGHLCVGFFLEWGLVPEDHWYLPWPLWMVSRLGWLCLAALPLHTAGNNQMHANTHTHTHTHTHTYLISGKWFSYIMQKCKL